MSKTFGNWRWWVMLPIILTFLVFALLLAAFRHIAEFWHFSVSQRVVSALRRLDFGDRQWLKTARKWTYGETE